jgi:hypothetical protein
MTPRMRVVTAARGAIGARFRLHGRDPASGLDCIGLAALALRAGGFEGVVPSGYALRGGDAGELRRRIVAAGLVQTDECAAGDLLVARPGPGQLHLAIDSGTGVIHADAMLRRVVERPGPPPWPVLARWRLPIAGD